MARALSMVDLSRRSQAEAALRSLTVTDPGQIPLFDQEFEIFFGRFPPPEWVDRGPGEPEANDASYAIQGLAGSTVADVKGRRGCLGGGEDLSSRLRRSRRRRPPGGAVSSDDDDVAPHRLQDPAVGPGDGSRPDLRRTLREAVGPTGDMMAMSWKRRRRKERPLIIIADISGSMEKYADIFLVFAHAAQRRLREVEIFTFSTHLSRITDDMRRRDTKTALARVADRVTDWSGGTQIGDALAEWNRRWSRRLARGGPVVMILSDGWDCGDPAVLSAEMARLARSVHQVIWLNPLAARAVVSAVDPGMQAVMSSVDQLLPAASVSDFRGVVRVLDSVAGARR